MDYDFGETDKDVVKIIVVCGKWHKGLEISIDKAKDPKFQGYIQRSTYEAIRKVVDAQVEILDKS